MSKAPARYTQSDVVRILKAAAQAHVEVRVKIDTAGNIVIATTGQSGASDGLDSNEWDEELFGGKDQTEVR
jgi:hypothetical protein